MTFDDNQKSALTFIDLFSGAGGMTYGFHVHPAFHLVAAFDGEFGKPSSGGGSLGCNDTFERIDPWLVEFLTKSAGVLN
jgi:DNA (cytosine-5)-methyltransferase 1